MGAAIAHQRRGLTDQATASFEQARSLLDPNDPAATPALISTPSVVVRLTPREREVAQLAALGLSDRAIADRLRLSVRTVGSHLNRAYTKLGVQGRAGLTKVFDKPPAGDPGTE